MAKTHTSIYLIKEGVDSLNDILDMEKVETQQAYGESGVLYGRTSNPHTPNWFKTMFGDELDSAGFSSSSASAVYLTSLELDDKQRFFALSFGYGRSMINPASIEERFGLKTVLGAVSEDSLRKISRTTVAGNAKKTNEQLPTKASIGSFSLDIERDLLDGVTAMGDKDSILPGSITGGDALSVSVEVSANTLNKFLTDILKIYASNAYKSSFSWLDRITAVKNPDLVNSLNDIVVEQINESSPNVWMAVPEMINWENTSGFKLPKSNQIESDILIEQVLENYNGAIKNIDVLKGAKVRMLDADASNDVAAWSLFNCLYGELEYDDEQYCITNGNWYLIDASFAAQINDSYEHIAISTTEFPECPSDRNENQYNRMFAEADSVQYALMDAKVITYGGGHSSIELCDVLDKEGRFIHVKNYHGSSALSHLFSQGLVSTTLVKSDNDFRMRASNKLADEAPAFAFDLNQHCVKEVVYGIICKRGEKRPNIPFFSKITLDYVSKQLRLMDVEVSIGFIKKW